MSIPLPGFQDPELPSSRDLRIYPVLQYLVLSLSNHQGRLQTAINQPHTSRAFFEGTHTETLRSDL